MRYRAPRVFRYNIGAGDTHIPLAIGTHLFRRAYTRARTRANTRAHRRERARYLFAKKSIDNSRMPDRACRFVMEGCFSFGGVGVKGRLLSLSFSRTTERAHRTRFYLFPLTTPLPLPASPIFSISGRKCYFSVTPRHAAVRF